MKKKLRSLELQYAMLYPACLWVVARDEVHFFEKPTLAMQWLDREERSLLDELGRHVRAIIISLHLIIRNTMLIKENGTVRVQ